MGPSNEREVAECVREARDKKQAIEIVAGGTKRACGRPMGPIEMLDVSALDKIISYEPEELILTVQPGIRLGEIAGVLAGKNQRLGFDPADWSRLFGAPENTHATLGGTLSADASGSGAVRFGRARDSLLGLRAVNGLGEVFKAGGKVVKNVTGFDIPKLVCGAFGTLCVLTEVTFRVYPRPAQSMTLAVKDIAPDEGLALLREIWSGALEPTGLAYIPATAKFAGLGEIGRGAALARVEGASAPLKDKLASLREIRADMTEVEHGDALFAAIGTGALFAGENLDVWRVMMPPSTAAQVVRKIAAPLWLADWAGGLLWTGSRPGETERVRAAAVEAGGHALLLRGDTMLRARAGLFAPTSDAHTALAASVKAAFDPFGLFNPGRL